MPSGVLGRVTVRGQLVWFSGTSLDLASDDEVRYVIADELVHVWQWATGLPLRPVRRAEEQARRLALSWCNLSRCPRSTPALRSHLLAVNR